MHELEKEKSLTNILPKTNTNVGQAERIVSGIAGGGLIAYGLKRRDAVGAGLAIVGGFIGLRGATGHCQVYDAAGFNTADEKAAEPTRIHVQKSVTINKSAAELYSFWRNFENLPKFMNHLESVKVTGDKTSHWKAKAPFGYSVEWDAELTSDVENEKIGWKSAELSEIPNSGTVEFLSTSNRGTEVRVTLTFTASYRRFAPLQTPDGNRLDYECRRSTVRTRSRKTESKRGKGLMPGSEFGFRTKKRRENGTRII
jgi:uncharacterized membrane protein